jgi:hypothetical protein
VGIVKGYRLRGRAVPTLTAVHDPLVCAVESCGKTAVTKGFCNAHYCGLRKVVSLVQHHHMPRICSEADCDKRTVARGLCWKHYRRVLRTGTTLARVPGPRTAL